MFYLTTMVNLRSGINVNLCIHPNCSTALPQLLLLHIEHGIMKDREREKGWRIEKGEHM